MNPGSSGSSERSPAATGDRAEHPEPVAQFVRIAGGEDDAGAGAVPIGPE